MSNNTANFVELVPNKETGSLVTSYKSKQDYGYIHVQSVQLQIVGGWLRESKRVALFRGKVSMLEMFLKMHLRGKNLPGRIQITEFLENSIPESARKLFFNPQKTEEENLAPYLKRAGKDGDLITIDGQRVVRFSTYDNTGGSTDLFATIGSQSPAPVAPVAPAAEQELQTAADDIIAAADNAPF